MARHHKAAQLYPSQTIGISFDSKSLKKQLDDYGAALKEKALRPAAFAAATVLYDEIRLRAPEETGGLRDATYRYRDITRTHAGKEVWTVGVNRIKAPHFHLIEYGHLQPYATFKGSDGHIYTNKKQRLIVPKFVPAQPYFRPSYDAKINGALQSALDTLKVKIKDLV